MQTKRNLCVKLAGVTAVLTLLSACQTSSFGTAEHIDFRAERFEDLRVVADFNDCKNDGLDLDRAAEESKDFSLHLASAEKLLSCHYELGNKASLVDTEQNMKVVALSAQNFIKGGDVGQARTAMEIFETSFNGRDLLYPDSSSFTQTMQVILEKSKSPNQIALANINARPRLKKEIRRAWRWLAH